MKRRKLIKLSVIIVTFFLCTSFMVPANAITGKVTKVTITNCRGSKNLVMKPGSKKKLAVKVKIKGKKVSKKVTYKSSNKKIVKVSTKGMLTARKKSGSAKITVTSKANKKIKATIKVTIGQPVSAISFAKNSVLMRTGTKQRLAVSVKPNSAKIKSLGYESSNKTIATVDRYGNVTAKKAGRAVITAKSQDGSAKSARYTVTVQDPVKIASASMVNRNVIKFTLSRAQKVNQTAVRVWVKTTENGNFVQEEEITGFTNSQNKNYTVSVMDERGITKGMQVKIQIAGLWGTGNDSKVIRGNQEPLYDTKNIKMQAKLGEFNSLSLDAKDDLGLDEITIVSADNLPVGMKAFVKTGMQRLYFTGTPTKAGCQKSVITLNTSNSQRYPKLAKVTIYWMLYSDTNMVSMTIPRDYYFGSKGEVRTENIPMWTLGGTAPYKYEIVDNKTKGNFYLSGDNCVWKSTDAGNDYATIKITDSSLIPKTSTFTVRCNRYATYTVSGKVTNRKGEVVRAEVYLYDLNEANHYGTFGSHSMSGNQGFSESIVNGTYMAMIKYNDKLYYYPSNIVVNGRNLNGFRFVVD